MSIFLGIVQGVTEFLPVSSSGHLALIQSLFGYSEDDHLFFAVLLHFGTLIAIFIVYREDIKSMIADTVAFIKKRSESGRTNEPLKPSVRMVLLVIVGTLPLLIAVFFMSQFERLFYMPGFVGFALLVTGGVLYVSDRYITNGNKREKTMTIKDALIIGFVQAIAIIPGLSRSGATIAVGMTRGLNRTFAVRFSLLLSIPAVLGSGIVMLVSAIRDGINASLIPVYLIGFVVAAVVGYFSVNLLRRIVTKKGRFGSFAYYCWAIGVLTIILAIAL